MRTYPRALALALLLAACDGGHDDDPTPDADPGATPRQTVMETKQLLIGQLAEATLTGGGADSARITLMAPVAKLDWNIHGHAGGGSQTVKEEMGVMSTTYTFVPPAQADWSVLLRNRDAAPMDVAVKIELFGEMQWSGWQ